MPATTWNYTEWKSQSQKVMYGMLSDKVVEVGRRLAVASSWGRRPWHSMGVIITSSIRINFVMVEYFWFLTVVVVTWANACNKIVPTYTHFQTACKTVEISLNSGLYQYQSPGFAILQVMQRCYHWRTLGEG